MTNTMNENEVLPTQTKTLGECGKLAVEKHFRKILRHETEVIKDSDPEGVHQMRVGMRRLRSAISGFENALDLPKAMAENKISKIAQVLGSLRDLDVLKESLEHPNYHLPKSEQKSVNFVLESLAKQRKIALENVQATLKKEEYSRFKQAAKKWLQQPLYKGLGLITIEEVLPDLLMPAISKFLLNPGWLVGKDLKLMNPDKLNEILKNHGEILHSLRKLAKKIRYQMELFTEFYGVDYQQYLEDCQQIQTILGEIQDSIVLAEFISSVLESDMKQQMPTFNKKLAENRYNSWQQWQKFQQKYLKLEVRQKFYLSVLYPVSE